MMAISSVKPLPCQFFVGPRIHVPDLEIEDLLVQVQPELEAPEREDELECLKGDMKIVLETALAAHLQAGNLRRYGDLLTFEQQFIVHRFIADQYQSAILATGDSGTLQGALLQFLQNVNAAEGG